jgi:hypothetical protein
VKDFKDLDLSMSMGTDGPDHSPADEAVEEDSAVCETSSADGTYGTVTGDATTVVSWLYGVETDLATVTTSDSLEDNVLSALERDMTDYSLRFLFAACGSSGSSRTTNSSRRFLLLGSNVIGVSSLPEDSVMTDLLCSAVENTENDCFVVLGKMALYLDFPDDEEDVTAVEAETEEDENSLLGLPLTDEETITVSNFTNCDRHCEGPEEKNVESSGTNRDKKNIFSNRFLQMSHQEVVRNAMRQGMNDGTFDDSHESIVRVFYIESEDDIYGEDPIGEESRSTGSENEDGVRAAVVAPLVAIAGVLVIATGLFAYRRRRRQQQEASMLIPQVSEGGGGSTI